MADPHSYRVSACRYRRPFFSIEFAFSMANNGIIRAVCQAIVVDRPKGATHVRLKGATYKWPF